jgi:hypothetical protein
LDKIIVSNKNNSVELNQKNLKHYIFTSEDKIVLDGVKYDFSFDNDTLKIFDKIKLIQEVELYKNKNKKKAKTFRLKKGRGVSDIFTTSESATFIQNKLQENSYLRSISVFVHQVRNNVFDYNESLNVKIVDNKDGFPDVENEIINFDVSLLQIPNSKNINEQKWEIELPNRIKIPKDDFFIVLFLKKGKQQQIGFRLNDEGSPLKVYLTSAATWINMPYNGFYFEFNMTK